MIIWAEGFDHYGTGVGSQDMMLRSAWGAFVGHTSVVFVSNAQHRTGACALHIGLSNATGSQFSARRVLGAAKTVIGCGFGMYSTALPGLTGIWGMAFRDASNDNIVSLRVNSDGSIGVYGPANTLLQVSDPVLTASAWHHIESKVVVDNIVGEIEVRVNGHTILHATDLDLGSDGCNQLHFGLFSTTTGVESGALYYDDIVAWDDTGDFNTDFLGQQRVLTLFPAGDEATQDWLPNGEDTGYECIDDATPDDDGTYISAANEGDVSEFTMPTLPPETANVVGIFIPALARLSDAGIGGLQVSLVSDDEVSAGPDDTLTAAYSYWPSLHEVDPNTGELWTKEAVEAAILRVEKTS